MITSIQFINHASVIVSDGVTNLLCDPWYTGDAFHKGWNLLHEIENKDIELFLNKVTHIWISHEHPDHFSIAFFKTFSKTIKDLSIKILFQKTQDQRVYKFLISQGLEVNELEFNKKISLSNDYQVICIKDGFYDSALLIESHGEKILNLNDCEITTAKRAKEVFGITGEIDLLLTQFSFAAWKGGKENKNWRDQAAKDKINTMKLQIEMFNPKFVIPFASFVYFSNNEYFYLNDAINKPSDLKQKLEKYKTKLIIMSPFDTFKNKLEVSKTVKATSFWDKKYKDIKPINYYNSVDINTLKENFINYCDRIKKNNNLALIKLIRLLSPINAFKPCVVFLIDLNLNLKFDYVDEKFNETRDKAMLSMKSESLDFLFKNSFGFDTLTVNGCFEEEKKNGFVDATKTLAIENLNNLGIKIEFKTLFNFSVIKLFLTKLYRVAKKLDD